MATLWTMTDTRTTTVWQGRHLMHVLPVPLDGRLVRLELLSIDHVDALWVAGSEASIWTWANAPIDSRDAMRRYVEEALALAGEGKAIPFAMVVKESNWVVGSTRFGSIDPVHRRVEIGWTWLMPSWQRTFVNTEAKLLMLRHAFEVMGCVRVEFKTDALNDRSRRALARLGAKEEGTLRSHMITSTGRIRDSVYFSITANEWPAVRIRLEAALARRVDNLHPPIS